MSSDEVWVLVIYVIIPAMILELIFGAFEIFIYQPAVWLSVVVTTAIPLLAFPIAFVVLWVVSLICMFFMDIPYYWEQIGGMARKTARFFMGFIPLGH